MWSLSCFALHSFWIQIHFKFIAKLNRVNSISSISSTSITVFFVSNAKIFEFISIRCVCVCLFFSSLFFHCHTLNLLFNCTDSIWWFQSQFFFLRIALKIESNSNRSQNNYYWFLFKLYLTFGENIFNMCINWNFSLFGTNGWILAGINSEFWKSFT